jgi:eukaryotic-like serine/threonine-protein kinase
MDRADVSIPDTLAGDAAPEQFIEAEQLEPGAVVAKRYRVVRQMTRDDVGVSVLVEDMIWGEEIVLKFLHWDVASNESRIKQLIQELRDARKIVHVNILQMYDLLPLGASYAVSLEYFSGHSLVEELKQGPLNVRRGLRIAWDICRGLHAASQVGMVHRELTPSSIMVNYTGGVKVVRNFVPVHDVGAAAREADALLRAPVYLAPEHVQRGILDVRTNIYSLGVIMYEMFTGRPPYVADDAMTLPMQHVTGKPIPPRQLRPELLPDMDTVILKTMAVDPAQRFQSTDDVRRSLAVLFRQAPG